MYSKRYEKLGCRKNFPVKTCAISAPLCAIGSFPLFTTAKENGTINILNYDTFTLVAFFNKHADLMMLRYMPHPVGSKTPPNLGPAAMASATAFELVSPEINVLSMVQNNVDDMLVSLQGSMPGSEILTVDAAAILTNQSIMKGLPLEMLVATMDFDMEINEVSGNATFSSFEEEKWHSQDFLSPAKEELEMYPSQEDMKIFKIGRRIKWVAAFLMMCTVGYAGVVSWNKVRDPAWSYKKQNIQGTSSALVAESKRFSHWDNLLKDRSKAWVCMEFISQLTPADDSVVLKDVKHQVAHIKSAQKTSNSGFRKTWIVNGYASDKGLMHLEEMSTRDGIQAVFKSVAARTGSEAYLPDVNQRDVTVNLKQRSNPTYNTISPKSPTDRFRIAFTLTISQSFSSKDDLTVARIK